jgi:hypothetical protein
MAVIKVAHNDPYFKTTWPDGELHKPCLHANVNDGIGTEMRSPRLAGRTSILPDNVGPMEEITVDLPLHLDSEHLSIDLSAIQAQLDALDTRIDTLEALTLSHSGTLTTNASAIAAEATARAAADTTLTNADTALSTRITTIETRIPTPLANFVNDAAAASGGIAVGRMYRNGSVVMIRVT